ncbi:uncharacterized protein LOC127082315 [Lathyrus oleraceus]|uniref:uncharacterized protein LOC127082315 n=1 Tax=Pisum sativum TaxID=3888 RepID=UPI0021CFB48D|nr:uncharacterized protein LOC127082315 [Pisum sativum]
MVTIGKCVENGLKSGKITNTTTPQITNKRPHGGFVKKKEGEANVVTTSVRLQYQFPMAPMSYYPYLYVAAAQYQQPSFQYQLQKGNQQSTPAQRSLNHQCNCDNKGKSRGHNNRRNFGNRPQFDKILVPYAKLVHLIHVGAIVPRELPTAFPLFNHSHNPNATCAFHIGYIGHSTEDRWALKKRIQELIDQEIMSFSEEKPNVKTNPLPNHGGAAINTVIKEENVESILRDEEAKTSMSVVLQRLERFGFLEGVHDDCAVCEFDPDNCDKLRGCVQELTDQGLIQFSKSKAAEEVAVIEPIIIVYKKRRLKLLPRGLSRFIPAFPLCSQIANIAGTGGMNRSGCVFAPKYTHRVSLAPTIIPPKEKVIPTSTPQVGATLPATLSMMNAPVLTKVINNKVVESETSKGKGPMVEKEQVEDHKKSITFEESQELLKLIKKSDFKIVDQLNQTPSKISILSLLLSSEAHRKALLKVLNAAHVMQDITVDQFDDVVGNITASRYLGFNEAELPPEGNSHNKALHISVTCTNSLLSRVLVDTGSSLNVLPKSILSQLQFKGPKMRSITLIVRAFDGSRRHLIGEVDLPIYVGPHEFSITFQVMDINPTYSCLLGKPWIHAAGAVTSTLHQRLKYLIDD